MRYRKQRVVLAPEMSLFLASQAVVALQFLLPLGVATWLVSLQ
jgi:hypothetical protein